jgi:hypothetical protein
VVRSIVVPLPPFLQLPVPHEDIVRSSFLPQDKVSEFAQMNSCQLLRETQRAAGDERLTEWHDTLIAAGKELKVIQDVRILLSSLPSSQPC